MNPARALGPAVVSGYLNNETSGIHAVSMTRTLNLETKLYTFGAKETPSLLCRRPNSLDSGIHCLIMRDSAIDSEQFWRELKTYLFAGHSKR